MNRSDPLDNVSRFSGKADLIARYRWPFAPEAVEALVRIADLEQDSRAVDVGSGTGALTSLLLQAGLYVTAVEPNKEMRAIAERKLAEYERFRSVAARSDATGLSDHSLEVVTVARAIHWLPSASTRREFVRILKPCGWLAIFATKYGDLALLDAVRSMQLEQNGWDVKYGKANQPQVALDLYYGGTHYEIHEFPGTVVENWQDFVGRLRSFSNAPDPDKRHFWRFVEQARLVFDRFAVDNCLTIPITTNLTLGKVLT